MIKIIEPFCGAVLNYRNGRKVKGGLEIPVWGTAPMGEAVTVNGTYARRFGDRFAADIVLSEAETDIAAVGTGVTGISEHRIRVVWDRYSKPRYRFAIDDNSFFLRDIAAKSYKSLFQSFYLDGLRKLHRKYGTKFVLNLFYTTPENDFNLSKFPSRYKGEWKDNSNWLKLAFHAYAEFPDRPYEYVPPGKLAKDLDLVNKEIVRFAGKSVLSPPTVIHWAMVHPAAWQVLVKRGVKVLSGDFITSIEPSSYTSEGENFDVRKTGTPFGYDINYQLDDARSEYLTRHDALKDFSSGIVFSKTDIVCNNVPLNRVEAVLKPLTHDPNQAEIMDLFTHEQYFFPSYFNYKTDHFKRVESAIRFCTQQGYDPVFFHEGFLGGKE